MFYRQPTAEAAPSPGHTKRTDPTEVNYHPASFPLLSSLCEDSPGPERDRAIHGTMLTVKDACPYFPTSGYNKTV